MADYNKIGLLILNADKTKFLVCEPGKSYISDKPIRQYLMPGGQLMERNDIECLQNEIKEELNCDIDITALILLGEYEDQAATPGKTVMIRLYRGQVIGTPTASTEIGALHWIGSQDIGNDNVSPIIRNKIIPDLLERKIITQ